MSNVGEWEGLHGVESHIGSNETNAACDGWSIDPFPEELLDSPLDLIFSEHLRQRQAAVLLNRVSNGEFDEIGIVELIAFLENDFVQHTADEELFLFPVLKQECLAEDNIESLIARLTGDHSNEEAVRDGVVNLLKKRLAGSSLERHEMRRIRHFAEHTRQHLAFENAVMLPIARIRVADAALKSLSDGLKSRRAKT